MASTVTTKKRKQDDEAPAPKPKRQKQPKLFTKEYESFTARIDRAKTDEYYKENNLPAIQYDNLTIGSDRKLYWRCIVIESHLSFQKVKDVVQRKIKCSDCRQIQTEANLLWIKRPDLFEQIDRNVHTDEEFLNQLTYGSTQELHWICKNHLNGYACDCHKWVQTVNSRTNVNLNGECPYCATNSCPNQNCLAPSNLLSKRYPEVFNQIDKSMHIDEEFLKTLSYASSAKLPFVCPTGGCSTCGHDHKYSMIVYNRTFQGSDCPYCSGKKVCPCRSMAAVSWLNREFHPEKNNGKKAEEFSKYSNKLVRWQCYQCDADFDASPQRRMSGLACPNCSSSRSTLELQFESTLQLGGYAFSTQMSFEDCKVKIPLRFDFFLSDFNVLGETDGPQHFWYDRCNWYKYDRQIWFNAVRSHDIIKNLFCHETHRPLIRYSMTAMAKLSEQAISAILADFVAKTQSPGYLGPYILLVGDEFAQPEYADARTMPHLIILV